jgi:HNH endonuclease
MPSKRCIYCLQERDESVFNVDHVVPRACGLFEGNLTLDCVCVDCNSYFGRTIEFTYARDSLEAFLRLIHGTKPAREGGRTIRGPR